MAVNIAIDAMSGDHGVSSSIGALPLFYKRISGAGFSAPNIMLVGNPQSIQAALRQHKLAESNALRIVEATEVVEMTDAPSQALRNKKNSSMRVAINLVKSADADVTISAGNTGALMATAKFVLKTIPGIDRPALCTRIPTRNAEDKIGHVHVLDLGANIDSSAAQLAQFGIMGSVLANVLDGAESPIVRLLNIGQEELKGNEQVKDAAELLAKSNLNYQGFVEGDTLFHGETDVVVCDGFVGNAVLKTMEGTAKLIGKTLRAEYRHSIFSKLAGLFSIPVMKRVSATIDPRNYNGAPLLGLNGLVFKSHGGADAVSFANAIYLGYLAAKNDLVKKTSSKIADNISSHQQSIEAEAA